MYVYICFYFNKHCERKLGIIIICICLHSYVRMYKEEETLLYLNICMYRYVCELLHFQEKEYTYSYIHKYIIYLIVNII